jgi:hypothetical protein
MKLKTQILKDYGLSSPATTSAASRKMKVLSKFVTQQEQQLKDIWRTHVEANTSRVYEVSIDHGYNCRCCTVVTKESVTCPTKEEQSLSRRRGRPRVGR